MPKLHAGKAPAFCMAVALTLLLAINAKALNHGPKPNVVFILVDDLGWKDLGIQGSVYYQTPHMDHLAESGMRFTDAYTPAPMCSPTRAAIMTGKHPTRLKITDWIPGDNSQTCKLVSPSTRCQLPLAEKTIAEVLKSYGYKTFFAGKWHLGSCGSFPEDHGFDLNKGGNDLGHPVGGYYAPYQNPQLEDGPPGEYLTDRLTKESIRFMEKNQNQPFFIFLSFYAVHWPIQGCKRLLAENQQRKKHQKHSGPPNRKERGATTKLWQDDPAYASMVQAVDENVGRFLAKLAELKLADRTIVILTSDNGGLATLATKCSIPTSNAPLRTGKGWCYEGGIRVPLIIYAPGVTRGGSTCTVPVTSMDLFSTILDLVGLPLQPSQHIDGLSLLPLMQGKTSLGRKAIYWHYPHYNGCRGTPSAAIRVGDWKLIELYEQNKVELYNLKNDIGEERDLSAAYPAKVKELRGMLHAWQKKVGVTPPKVNPMFRQYGSPQSLHLGP